jgi:rRNA maturation protein Nop10
MIEFLCPNGHRIRCAAEQAGRAAKCPRCGVDFRVPNPAKLDIANAADSDPNVARPEFTDSGLSNQKSSSSGKLVSKESQIEFLCPNGHRLFGPAKLQGKAGQCPECGSRFIIPTYDEAPAEAESAPPAAVAETALPPGITTDDAKAHGGMAALVERMWRSRPQDAVLELHLAGGDTFVVHQYLDARSRESGLCVFAVREADGQLTLSAVAWPAVAAAVLRGLKELPRQWAD